MGPVSPLLGLYIALHDTETISYKEIIAKSTRWAIWGLTPKGRISPRDMSTSRCGCLEALCAMI